MDRFKIGKGGQQECILSPYLFNLHTESIMQNAGLDESQAGIKVAGRKQNLIYADDITLMADISLPMRMKEESETADLKFNIQKMKIRPFGPITSWQIEGKKVEAVTDFIFLGSKITEDSDCSHEIKRCLLLRRKAMKNLESILKN